MARGRAASRRCVFVILPWVQALIPVCLFAVVIISGVLRMQKHVAIVPEPDHPVPTIVQSLNFGKAPRANLVVAVVGDTSMHTRWMANFSSASWDLAVIYTGSQSNFSCPGCVHVEINKGAKWLLVYGFTQSAAWQESYQHRYDMVYVPDDDILQTTSIINSVFELHAQYRLLMSQPMLCSWLESHSSSWDVIKWPTTVLRYTNFVEIMVPVFSMSVFNSTVMDTLKYATTGWGLDWLWPFLLGYPHNKIAFIDEVCVVHPKGPLQLRNKPSMYTTNHSAGGEEFGQYARLGYDTDSTSKYGMVPNVQKRLGQVWQPWYETMLQQAGMQVEESYAPEAREVKLGVNAALHQQHAQQSQAAMQQQTSQALRTNLVVVTGQPLWLPAPQNASWEIAMVHQPNVTLTCPACLLTFSSSALGRYAQLHELVQSAEWRELHVEQYQYIYLPDSKVYHASDQIDRMFDMMSEYNLLLGHPSVCSDLESDAHLLEILRRQPTNVLRYTTAVDFVAPIFDMTFFQDSVVQTLTNAKYGHGLQWVWPFLLGYAPRTIAVLDEVCMVHARNDLQNALKTSLTSQMQPTETARKGSRFKSFFTRSQASMPGAMAPVSEGAAQVSLMPGLDFTPLQPISSATAYNETKLQLKRADYRAELYGVKDQTASVVGYVFQPWYQELLDMGNLQVSAVFAWSHMTVRKADEDTHLSSSVTRPFVDMAALEES